MMNIKPAAIRNEVQVILPSGQAYNGVAGTTVEEFILAADLDLGGKIVAALVNGQLRELSYSLHNDATLVPVTMKDSDGVRIYRRSLSFLMIVAAQEVFPGKIITVQHSMPYGGYYNERNDGHRLSTAELEALRSKMVELVQADLSITQVKVPLDEALQLFRDSGDLEKADLFSRRRKDYLTLYELAGVRDYFHGFMVPRTSYLDLFDLRLYGNGFILQFPRRRAPEKLQPFVDEPRLARVFREYDEWLSVIGVPSVAVLNAAIRAGRMQEVILVAEALHNRQLATIASDIASCRPALKIVLISGPSSAGKTTFSKRLAIQLLAMGIHPVAINMDNYFVDRELTPRDRNGEYDFETLEALDVPLFRHHLQMLLAGRKIDTPRYSFQNGKRELGPELQIGSEQVMLIEGIHGLNPRIVDGIPPEATYRIFVSAFTQLNLDRHNRVPTTDTRMLRRIVRDAARRGYTAADTIKRWPSVRRGEKRHIFPNQSNANVFFNSALVYELSVLKPLAQPLLLQVENQTPERIEANRLLAFLQWFDPVTVEGIPSDSILREFVGGSILEKFEPWRQ
ncbi:MAG TPA: TGS domain-containing protein [candidate division Zixibacteria bacterium]|nr:TGS domain-containing protein [candidate division Zixibacteria bacterium]